MLRNSYKTTVCVALGVMLCPSVNIIQNLHPANCMSQFIKQLYVLSVLPKTYLQLYISINSMLPHSGKDTVI